MSEFRIRPQDGFQERFLSTKATIAIGGGAAGCGKSFALVYDPLRYSGVQGFNAIVFRRVSTEIRGGGGIWDESCRLYPHMQGRRTQGLEWRFPSGARIAFSHLQYKQDVWSHQSKQYTAVFYDELTTFEEYQFWFMLSRNRSMCGVRPYIRAGCNPDPRSWVAKLVAWWIDERTGLPIPERNGKIRWFLRRDDSLHWGDTRTELLRRFPDATQKEPLSLTFIAGRLDENKILERADPGYRARLMALPLVDRVRFLDGNWKALPGAGQYYRRDWIKFVDRPPEDVEIRVRAWDKAGTFSDGADDKGPAWTVGVKMSRKRDGAICIEHVRRFRGSPHAVEKEIKATAEADGRGTEVWIWQDPGQAGKADVDNFVRNILQGFSVHGEPAREDKETYAKPMSAQAEAGNVLMVRAEWNDAYLDELEAFPEGRFKDQVDASSLGFLRVCKSHPITGMKIDLETGYAPSYWSSFGESARDPRLSYGNE